MNIIISFLSFSKDVFGGIENSIYNKAKGFIENGHKVYIYTSYLAGEEKNLDNITIFRSEFLPKKLPVGTLNADFFVKNQLRQNASQITNEICELIYLNKIELLIVVDPLWGIVQNTLAWQKINCPMILSLHVVNKKELLTESGKIPFVYIKTVSKSLKNKLSSKVPLKNVKVIPNSIDTKLFSPSNNIAHNSKIIFCNARLVPGKGIEHLIKGFYLFQKEYPEFVLWLCGGVSPFGDNHLIERKILKKIKDLSIIKNVKILPNLKWKEIPDVIRQSFVVVLPSKYETFGRAAIETISCGVPLITTDVGNIKENINGNGIFVSYGKPTEIYEALCKLMNNKELYFRLCKKGVKIAQRFDNKIIAQNILSHLQKKK